MAFPSFIFLAILISLPFSQSKLSPDYYKSSCPDFETIVRDAVTAKHKANPTAAAATLRLFFQDCMIGGCDGSLLIASNSFNKAERDADINLSLSGDAFDVVTRIKTALELNCPGIVSCSDVLALATHDFIGLVGGPNYVVRLGRKDSLESSFDRVENSVPRVNTSMDEIIKMFESMKLTAQDLVALSGAHTIGLSHCKEFAYRLNPVDPAYNPKYAEALKTVCKDYENNPAMSAFIDAVTPSKFDNMYYQNLQKGMGLLESDSALLKNPKTKPFVELYATNQTAFFNDFAHAMEKLAHFGVKTGNKGEVRRKCEHFNSIQP